MLQINELGWCITNTAIRIDKETRRPKTWKCNDECKPVSDNDKRVIDLLQLSFKEPVRKVRETLDNLDSHCPHGHYSDNYGKDLLGHPLPCCISECFSELRTVQAASVHIPEVRSFLRLLYTARLSNATIEAIDNELSLADYNSLLSRIDVDEDSLGDLFKKPDNYDSNHSILNQSDSLCNLESLLQVQYAGVTNNWLKEMNDDPEFACCSCERLHKRSGVTRVKLDSDKWKTEMWQTLLTYVKNCETDCNIDYYVCKYCLKELNHSKMPARCVLNELYTVPIPHELAGLDRLSCQLIQRAKAFQTIIRLGTYTGNVPKYNSLKACKGTMFFLPLPMNKTLDTLCDASNDPQLLPDPDMYIIVNGKPTKDNIVWQQLVNIEKIKSAFNKLKEINWLYKSVDNNSIDDVAKNVIEVCDSASSTMLEKITSDDIASFQAYTIRQLDQRVSITPDIDQYKMLNVQEDAIDSRQQHLDVMCFPVLFPNGNFGEHYPRKVKITSSEFMKSRLLNKDSRFRKDPQYVFYLLWQTELRQLSAGIYNLMRSGKHKHGLTVNQFLNGISSSCENVEANLSTIFMSVRGTKQYWFLRNSELKCMIREWGTPHCS